MRAVVVTPATRTVEARDIPSGLRALQSIVGGYIEGVYPGNFDAEFARTHGYVNEEGLFNQDFALHPWAILPGYPHLVGPAVFLDDNGRGDDRDCSMSVEQIYSKILWKF